MKTRLGRKPRVASSAYSVVRVPLLYGPGDSSEGPTRVLPPVLSPAVICQPPYFSARRAHPSDAAQDPSRALARRFLISHRAAPCVSHLLPLLSLSTPSEWLGSSLAWRLHPVCLEGAQFSPPNLGFCFENKGGKPCSPLSGLQALCCKSWWKCEVTHYCHTLILCTELRSKNQPGPTAELLSPGRKPRERIRGCLVAGSNPGPLLPSPS